MFLKRVIVWYGMICYAMLCYPMLWYGMESMVCYDISMLCYDISMLSYVLVYVVKDKYSPTVRSLYNIHSNLLSPCLYKSPEFIHESP